MERTRQQGLNDVDIETIPPEPGLTAPLDHVREDEKGMQPAPVMPAATETDQRAVDADIRDDAGMGSSGTVDARGATDREETVDADATDETTGDDSDDTDSDDVDGTDSGDDSGGDDSSDDVDGTDTGDDTGDSDGTDTGDDTGDSDGTDTGDDTGDSDDSDSEDAKVDAAASDGTARGTGGNDAA